MYSVGRRRDNARYLYWIISLFTVGTLNEGIIFISYNIVLFYEQFRMEKKKNITSWLKY